MRATILTDEMIAQADAMLGAAADQKTVYEYLGVSEGAWYSWVSKGSALIEQGLRWDDEGITPNERLWMKLAETVTRAKARGRMLLIRELRVAIEGDWRGILEVLARRAPSEWGRGRIEQPGRGGSSDPIRIFIPDNGKVVYGNNEAMEPHGGEE
jgi:hypothetical protein